MRASRRSLVSSICTALVACASHAHAIDPSGVLVLFNTESQESIDIANHYLDAHPGVNLLGLSNLGTSSTITATQYLNNIRQPILDSGALTSNIDVIVTTKGMPLKIDVEQLTHPGSYIDSHGVQRFTTESKWKLSSSLESELTKIDYIATETMMGDQYFNWPLGHFTNNAYYQSSASFSFGNFTGQDVMRLTARLDGFTVGDVNMAIDRAQNAFVGPNNTPGGPYRFIVDHDPTADLDYADQTLMGLRDLLTARGLPHVYDYTLDFVNSAGGELLGYAGHGDHQIATPDNYVYALSDELADGAVFTSWESFNAQSFEPGGNYGNQALVAEWLNRGGTAAVGNVAEPYASPNNVINEDQLFAMLLEGKTFAEAAWSGARQLSWVNTVVGDPLMVWKQLLPGDVNMDGVVDMGDFAAMAPAAQFGRGIDDGGTIGWLQGDLNGDDFVDMADVALVASSWGQASDWSTATPNLTEAPTPMAMALFLSMHQVPEPSSVALMTIGLASLAALGWRRRRKSRPALSATD